jgi:predicted Zn-dependent protease
MTAREFDEAQKVTAELLSGEPDLNHLQGDLYLARQLAPEAVPFLGKAVAADPRVLEVRASLPRALLQAVRPAEALPHVNAALPLDTDGSLHFQLARAYQSAGQAEAAKEAMARYQSIRSKMNEQERVVEEDVQITAP